MIEFSAFADEVTDDFEGQVGFLTSQNVKNIEIRFVNGKNIMDLNKKELSETKKKLDDNGIGVSAIGSPIGKVKLDQPFEDHFNKFKHAVELADFFSAPFIRIFSYYAPDGKNIDDYREQVLERMGKKADFLKGSKIVMVHENESHIFGHNAENCVDMVKTIDSANLKLAYDPANFVTADNVSNNLEVCWPLMKPYVVHVHIKDWKLGKDLGSIPGEGDGQIKELLTELVNMQYAGYLTMEPHLKEGGQFGGKTGPELFAQAINATIEICDEVGLKYK